MKNLFKKVSIVLLVFALTACGSNGTGDKTESKEVYIVLKTLGGAYWSLVQKGAEDAAKELGYTPVVVGLANESEIEKQRNQISDAIAAKPAAIIFAPAESKALADAATEVTTAGIPLILVDTLVSNEDFDAAFVTDNVNAGSEAATQMIKQLKASGLEGKEGKILIQKGADTQTVLDRQKGFTDTFKADAPKEWTIDTHFLIATDAEIAFNQGVNAILDKDVIGVFGTNNGPSVGWARAIEDQNRKDIVAVTFDYSPEVAGLIANADYNVTTIVQRQYYMGYEGVKAGIKIAQGGTVSPKINDTGIIAVNNKNFNDAEVTAITKPQ